MNKPPAFQFYAKDWLSSKSVLRMTPSQCGYFINLLAHSWDNDPPGTLPNDPDFLWKMARAESKEKFESECSLVLDQFPVEKSGRKRSVLRFNPKLRSYYRAFCTQSKQKSEAAKARWDKKLQASAFSPQCPASASSSASASAPAKIKRNLPPEARELAMMLRSEIQKNDPDFRVKESQVEKWSDDADKMIRLDGISEESIRSVITWSQHDPFWSTNILSMGKLRKQYPQLKIKMSRENGGNGNGQRGNEEPDDFQVRFDRAVAQSVRTPLQTQTQRRGDSGHQRIPDKVF